MQHYTSHNDAFVGRDPIAPNVVQERRNGIAPYVPSPPVFQRALQFAIVGEVDVVGDAVGVVDASVVLHS
jgi:hypothetical protein